MDDDVSVYLSVDGGATSHPVTARQLRNAGAMIMVEMRKQLDQIVKSFITDLYIQYKAHARNRIDGSPNLMSQLQSSLATKLEYIPNGEIPELQAYAFDLEEAYAKTQARNVHQPHGSWFGLFEDDHDGRRHGSRWYGFLALDHALRLADQCADQLFPDKPGQRADLKNHVRENMAGRHGEGIMVRLGEPLFFAYPEFGTALGHGVEPHPGFTAWNIYMSLLNGPRFAPTGPYNPSAALGRAIQSAGRRINQGEGR